MKKGVNLQIPVELKERITTEASKRKLTDTAFIRECIEEKFFRVDRGIEPGPLAGLQPEDEKRIRRYVEVLRDAPMDTPLRIAVDKNFELYDWAARKGTS